MVSLQVVASMITLGGILLSFISSAYLALGELTRNRKSRAEVENRTKERLRNVGKKLKNEGHLEPRETGFSFVANVINSQMDDYKEIVRIEQPEKEGLGNDIHVRTEDGELYEGVITSIQLSNAIDKYAKYQRVRAKDSRLFLGTTLLALGFLIQAIGHVLSNIVWV